VTRGGVHVAEREPLPLQIREAPQVVSPGDELGVELQVAVALNQGRDPGTRAGLDEGEPPQVRQVHLSLHQRLDDSVGRRSLWRLAEENVAEEGPLGASGHNGDEVWRIVNPNLTNRLGQHPGYELRPGHSATSLLAPDDFPQRRAEFSAAPLWITAYDPNELYAGGPYPNQSKGGDGLPVYAARHRPVANADIVLWYTMGFHHLPRPEDWPVLPTMWHSVSLVPYGFLGRNPALGLRQQDAPGGPVK